MYETPFYISGNINGLATFAGREVDLSNPDMNASYAPPPRSQTLSPASNSGSQWSGMDNYDLINPSDSPYSPSLPYNRGELVTSLHSGGPRGGPPNHINSNFNFNSGPPAADGQDMRRPRETTSRGPSPPLSVANSRSSDGTLSDQQSRKYRRMEAELSDHYSVLRA